MPWVAMSPMPAARARVLSASTSQRWRTLHCETRERGRSGSTGGGAVTLSARPWPPSWSSWPEPVSVTAPAQVGVTLTGPDRPQGRLRVQPRRAFVDAGCIGHTRTAHASVTRKWRNGRRAGFRCQCPKGRGGSNPPLRTQVMSGTSARPEPSGFGPCGLLGLVFAGGVQGELRVGSSPWEESLAGKVPNPARRRRLSRTVTNGRAERGVPPLRTNDHSQASRSHDTLTAVAIHGRVGGISTNARSAAVDDPLGDADHPVGDGHHDPMPNRPRALPPRVAIAVLTPTTRPSRSTSGHPSCRG